ncbi:ABC transporter ATP-binding protein [Paenibacillus sp. UNC451MF]|uniref:ABC transporter ATP-binding protein n=1 Tax=Paenibacillus sp. UNC451MF TaxID=1449063 RepID=UPI00069243B1|nr:ABC transporter ATP-binding protein [Paenibacillus sp. UNC451MF]
MDREWKHTRTDLLRLLYYIWKQMPVLTSVWLTVPMGIGMLVIPLMLSQKHMIDSAVHGIVNGSSSISQMMPALLLFVGTMVLQVMAESLRKILDEAMNQRAYAYVQSEIFKISTTVSLERFEHTEFYDRLHRAQSAAGQDLIGILRNGVDTIQRLATLMAMAIVVAQGYWLLGWILLVMNGTSLYFRMKIELSKRKLDKQLTTDGRMSQYLMNQLTDSRTLKETKLFDSTGYLIRQWSTNTLGQRSRRFAMSRKENKLGFWISLLHIAGAFGSIAVLVLFRGQGGLTPGIVAVVFQTVLQSQGTSLKLSWPLSKLVLQAGKAEDLLTFLKEHIDEPNTKLKAEDLGSIKDITFEKVGYSYPNSSKPVLQDMNVTIRAGETIALVGDNGSGKSTFIKLLLGLYEPTEGQISWNGKNLSAMGEHHKALWSRVSAVFQDHEPYSFTLRENVAMGNLSREPEEHGIRSALEASGIQKLAEQSGEGLDVPLGQLSEGGLELSGGQWQRLAIARAMYRHGELIVLDEPTAAIDPASEVELFEQFRRLRQGKTALFVSHRLGWARYADRILVIDQGRLIEDGTHDQLMSLDGKYAAFYKEQAQWYQNSDLLGS